MSKHIYTSEQERLQVLLRQIRQEAGLRQIDLAQRLGQSQSFFLWPDSSCILRVQSHYTQ